MCALQILRKGHIPAGQVIPQLLCRVDVVQPKSGVLVLVLFQIPGQHHGVGVHGRQCAADAPTLRRAADPVMDQQSFLQRHTAAAHDLQCVQLPLADTSGKQPLRRGLVQPEKGRHGFGTPIQSTAVHLSANSIPHNFGGPGLDQLLHAWVACPQPEVGQQTVYSFRGHVVMKVEKQFRRTVFQRGFRDLFHAEYRVISRLPAAPRLTVRKRLRHGFLGD